MTDTSDFVFSLGRHYLENCVKKVLQKLSTINIVQPGAIYFVILFSGESLNRNTYKLSSVFAIPVDISVASLRGWCQSYRHMLFEISRLQENVLHVLPVQSRTQATDFCVIIVSVGNPELKIVQ